MELYKVMLVDDEEEIREGMAYRVDWEAFGFCVAVFAENGMEALELLESENPDVIFTDIRMPFMNGLEFLKKAIEIKPTIKIIIFSGFDDFEYAQKAISLNVEAYILKPISAVKLAEILTELKKKMDAEIEERRSVETLKKNYESSLPILKEQFLISWVEGRIQEDAIIERGKQYQISIQGKLCTVAVFWINEATEEEKYAGSSSTPEHLLLIALKKTAESILGKFHKIHSFIYADQVVVIAELIWESQITMFINEVNEVCKSGKECTGKIVAAGIGRLCSEPGKVRNSYKEACDTLEYSILLCKEGTYTTYIEDIEPHHNMITAPDYHMEQMLLVAIKQGDEKQIRQRINTLFKELESSILPFVQYQFYILKIFTSVLSLGVNYGDIYTNELQNINDILKMHSLAEIQEWITGLCLKVSGCIQQEQMKSINQIVNKAKQYVQEHYGDADLSADTICQELHVSATYFSTIFKKEEGVSFVSYLTSVRLSHAVKLLETTPDKTYIIAAKVGYAEPNYFSYVFKKKYGVAPSRYRKEQETK